MGKDVSCETVKLKRARGRSSVGVDISFFDYFFIFHGRSGRRGSRNFVKYLFFTILILLFQFDDDFFGGL
jgi:hypothetical protein